ncbi:MAG: adenylosuccinate synthetase [Blautia faecis]
MAYAYSDKYRKKTLRLGDLLHLKEDSVKARLKTMLEAKNPGACRLLSSSQCPTLYSLLWCEEQAELFGPYIADTGEYLEQAVSEGKRWYWKPSLEP